MPEEPPVDIGTIIAEAEKLLTWSERLVGGPNRGDSDAALIRALQALAKVELARIQLYYAELKGRSIT